MGNDLADAIRDELYNELIRVYGSIESAADAIGVPYKTLYRALTTKGKDRSLSVKLDLVMDIADHLADAGHAGFSDIYARAKARRDQAAASADRVLTIDDIDHVEAPDLSKYGLAAKRGTRKADQEPYAE